MMGTVAAQAINLISSPIITRIYSPEQFGIFSLYTSVIGPLSILCTMRLEVAMVISSNQKEMSQLKTFIYRLSLFLTVLGLFLVFGLLFVFPGFYRSWFFLVPLGLFFHVALQSESAHKNFLKNYNKIASARILQAGVMAIFAILMGQFFTQQHSLINASIIALVAAWLSIKYPFKLRTFLPTFAKEDSINLKKYSKYFYFTMPQSLLDTVSQQIPIFILGSYAIKEMTGYYGLALKVLILPASIFGASVAQIFLKRFSELWINKDSQLKIQLLKTWGVLALVGIVPFGLLYLFGSDLFMMVFGDEWKMAGELASLLSPMLYVNFICGPSSTAILVQNDHKKGLIFGVNALVTRAAALFYGVYKDDILLGFKIWVVIEIISMFAYSAVIWHNIIKRK